MTHMDHQIRNSGWARDCTYALGGAVSLSCRS